MALEIVWSKRASSRLEEIRAFVAKDKPEAAERLAVRIVALAEALREHPRLGHAGIQPDVRELVVGGTPYAISYRIYRGRIVVLSVWHGAQKRQTKVGQNPK